MPNFAVFDGIRRCIEFPAWISNENWPSNDNWSSAYIHRVTSMWDFWQRGPHTAVLLARKVRIFVIFPDLEAKRRFFLGKKWQSSMQSSIIVQPQNSAWGIWPFSVAILPWGAMYSAFSTQPSRFLVACKQYVGRGHPTRSLLPDQMDMIWSIYDPTITKYSILKLWCHFGVMANDFKRQNEISGHFKIRFFWPGWNWRPFTCSNYLDILSISHMDEYLSEALVFGVIFWGRRVLWACLEIRGMLAWPGQDTVSAFLDRSIMQKCINLLHVLRALIVQAQQQWWEQLDGLS